MTPSDKALCVWAGVHSSLHELTPAAQVDVLDHLASLLSDYRAIASSRSNAALALHDLPEPPAPVEPTPGLADAAPHTAAAMEDDDDAS